ncbi:MAG: PAS domain-containing protein, partial [Byssovorax sp.]
MNAEVLQRMLDRMPGVAWSARRDPATGRGSWIYVSPRAAEVYDVPEAELLADPNCMTQRLLPEDHARLDEVVARSIQTLAPMSWLGRLQRRDGEIRWLETQSTFEIDADGSQIWCGQVLDVTERKRAEDALAAAQAARARSDALHLAVIEALPVGVLVRDLEGKIAIHNSAARKITGRGAGDNRDPVRAYGIFMTDGVTPFPKEQLPLVRALAGEEEPESEMLIRGGDSEGERWVHGKGLRLRDASGKVVAGMVALRDITEQRALEREITTRSEQLAASEAAKTVLIERLRYSIDELSNPILE